MTEKTIRNWRIVPTKNGDVCLIGEVDGQPIQTTNVVMGRKGQVRTESGTIYNLGDKDPGLWELQLQMKRPVKYQNLVRCGVL